MVAREYLRRNDQYDTAMIKAMKALYWVMKENIALRKWHSLKDLLGQCSVDLSPLDYAGNVKYDSSHYC